MNYPSLSHITRRLLCKVLVFVLHLLGFCGRQLSTKRTKRLSLAALCTCSGIWTLDS